MHHSLRTSKQNAFECSRSRDVRRTKYMLWCVRDSINLTSGILRGKSVYTRPDLYFDGNRIDGYLPQPERQRCELMLQ